MVYTEAMFLDEIECDDDYDGPLTGQTVKVDGYGGVAWRAWQYTPDGSVNCVMIGDDRNFFFDPDDLTIIEREDYCGGCGQIGCGHDGLER